MEGYKMWFKKKSKGAPLAVRINLESIQGYADGTPSFENFVHRAGLKTVAKKMEDGTVALSIKDSDVFAAGKGLEDAATTLMHMISGKTITVDGKKIVVPKLKKLVN
jgi:hypothetical protein